MLCHGDSELDKHDFGVLAVMNNSSAGSTKPVGCAQVQLRENLHDGPRVQGWEVQEVCALCFFWQCRGMLRL